jgi:hypothetical protein
MTDLRPSHTGHFVWLMPTQNWRPYPGQTGHGTVRPARLVVCCFFIFFLFFSSFLGKPQAHFEIKNRRTKGETMWYMVEKEGSQRWKNVENKIEAKGKIFECANVVNKLEAKGEIFWWRR